MCLNLPQNGHAQVDFGGQGSQPHIEFSDVGLLGSGQHIVVQFTNPQDSLLHTVADTVLATNNSLIGHQHPSTQSTPPLLTT